MTELYDDCVANISQLTDTLYLTSIYGVNSVPTHFDVYICVAKELYHEYHGLIAHHKLRNGSRKFYYIPLNDTETENLANLHEYVALIKLNICKKKRVVVFCHLGVSRSASICIAYFIKEYNLTRPDAQHYVWTKRNIISPNRGFLRQLDKFSSLTKPNRHAKRDKNDNQ